MLSRKIILISGFGNACGHFWTLFSQQGSLLLFKSSYPLRMFPERLYVNIASTNAVQEILRQR